MLLFLGGWAVLLVGFTVGWIGRWRAMAVDGALRAGADHQLLVSISHLLEDAEAGLSSIEGTGGHRGVEQFTTVKSKVCLAQAMARNLLGVEQRFGRGAALDFPVPDRHSL